MFNSQTHFSNASLQTLNSKGVLQVSKRSGGLSHFLIASMLFVALFVAPAHAADWDREAAYTARVAEFKKQIAAQPNNPDALVALASFYLNPVANRQVAAADGTLRLCPAPLRDEQITGSNKDVYAVPWVFRGDAVAAKPLLDAALRLNPKHGGAHRKMAMVYRMRKNVDLMQRHVLQAIQIAGVDLDMARLYMDYHVVRARVCDDEAARLVEPFTYEEDRADGKRYRVTRYPSEANKAKARQLRGVAQQHRRESISKLRTLVTYLKDKPQYKSTQDLANAMYYHWLGKPETAGGAAKAALKADPTNLAALDYLIDLTRGTHTKKLSDQYRAIRDRWAGADTRIKTDSGSSLKPRR